MNAEAYTIRPAVPADRDGLKALMLEYIVEFYESPHPGDDKLDRLLDMLFEGRDGRQWVAESDGRVLGFTTLYYTYSTLRAQKAAVMNDLYVRPELRGTGAATELFEAIRSFAAEERCAYLGWETAADNDRARKFYEKMGGTCGSWVTYSIDLP